MHHFRKKSSSAVTPTNSPPPTPASPVVEYIKQELATFYPRAKDTRALAASSSAIALSIASPSSDPIDTSINEPGSSGESAWKTAYGAARIAVEIANASSDMFLPLKAVVGALSVLIKNYDQTATNGDQIREIEERIRSLGEVLTYPVGDQDSEEKIRREVLRKKLAGIVAKLRPLDEQHGLMRFLNNVDHANVLNGFVQELAYAITDYQTSLQQSTHENTKKIEEATNRIDNTTGKIDETTDRIDETTNKIDETASKIDETTNRIDETTGKIDGTTDRIDETTNKIDETTDRIDETTSRIDETTDKIDETSNKIDKTTKRIDETTKKIGEDAQNIIEAADHELLRKLNPVHNAGFKAGHHDTCLRGTRESVLDGIMRWAEDPQDRHVFWLNGLAGTGKSTIAQTFSEMAAKTGILGASFFCSRDYLDRKELKNIFPTLAYQLACRYTTFRRHIIRVIKEDPSVASNSLISQLEDLIVNPLSSSNLSCVIVVDALDECVDDQPASAILSVLGRHVKQLSSAKFFITGRPEPRIRTGFRLPLLEPFIQNFLLHEVKLSDVDDDIRLYLQDKLTAVSKRRSNLDLSDPWPRSEDLTTLTEKSSGLFIFASTLVRFIESEHHEPNERLELIITPSDSTVNEGRAGIDPLYTQILVHAFSDVKDTALFTNLRRVLGAVVLAFNPLSRAQIAGILGVNVSLIARSLRHLHSVLLVPAEDSKEIRVFHKSFPDFLQDRERCSDQKFFIDCAIHHGDMALDCLKLLKKLKPNPCNLPNFVMNRDVPNLPDLLEGRVGGASRYACGYWTMHVRYSPTTDSYAMELISSAVEFFRTNAIPWVEVMSLENRLESVIHSIYHLFDWLEKVQVHTFDLRSLAQDCLRFTMHFFHPIQQSASHIYHSALPLSPKSSTFHLKLFRDRTRIQEFHRHPYTWGAVVRTITVDSSACVTTFGHKIAIACDEGKVEIYDTVTGVLRLSLNPADPVHAMKGSQDGSVLFCTHQTPSVTSWDIQTGGLIHTFIPEYSVEDIAVSLKGRYLACRLSGGTVKVWEVATRGECVTIESGLLDTHLCWLEPEDQLVVTIGASVRIWGVVSAKILRRFTLQAPTINGMIYSQRLDRLIVVTSSAAGHAVHIFDPLQCLPSTSHEFQKHISCFTFSRTINQLVCGTEAHGLELFDISTQQWGHFEYPDRPTFISSLPNGTVVAKFASSGIQVLSLDDGHPTSQKPLISPLTVHAFDEDKIIVILPTSRDNITLLGLATMAQLLEIPARGTHPIPVDRTHILYASFHKRVAVYSFKEREKEYLQLWGFHHKDPKWTEEIGGQPSTAGISPFGAYLVTFYDVDNQSCVCVWNARTGELKAQLRVDPIEPLDIVFESETEFYSNHDTYRRPFVFSSSMSGDHPHTLRERPRTSNDVVPPSTSGHSISHRRLPPLTRGSQQRQYEVNEAREWVVSDSKRICWIPPGYIGSVHPSYWVVGNSLILAGQDGVLRKLAFQYQSEG